MKKLEPFQDNLIEQICIYMQINVHSQRLHKFPQDQLRIYHKVIYEIKILINF